MTKILAIDFDGTITKDIPYAPYKYGEPQLGMEGRLRTLAEQGWRIIVWTARSWAEKKDIEFYLAKHDLSYHEVHCCKIIADVYCDVKAKRPEELP